MYLRAKEKEEDGHVVAYVRRVSKLRVSISSNARVVLVVAAMIQDEGARARALTKAGSRLW